MIYCPQCETEAQGAFCPRCGAALDPAVPDIPGFGDAVKTCLKKSFTYRGRASRSEYWYFCLAHATAVIILLILLVSFDSLHSRKGTVAVAAALGAFCFVTLAPFLAVTVRRLHDMSRARRTDRPRTFPLRWLTVILAVICPFVLAAPSTPGPNRYGPRPRRRK
ncbi:MAG: DUF805 domain-containing protein [Thermoguttaceae bacterium]